LLKEAQGFLYTKEGGTVAEYKPELGLIKNASGKKYTVSELKLITNVDIIFEQFAFFGIYQGALVLICQGFNDFSIHAPIYKDRAEVEQVYRLLRQKSIYPYTKPLYSSQMERKADLRHAFKVFKEAKLEAFWALSGEIILPKGETL